MKRFIPLVVLFVLFVGLSFTGSPIAPRTLALYDHPAQPGHMVDHSAPADFSCLDIYTAYTHMERDRHYLTLPGDYHVIMSEYTRLTNVASEGRVYVEHDTRRWHRGAWRRVQ